MVPLRDLALRAPPPIAQGQRGQARILVAPFSDERGHTWARDMPTSHIPVVSLFHQGSHFYYPEQSGTLHHELDGKSQVASGALDSAMPALLVQTMRRMGLTPNAFTVEEGGEYDYLVRGTLRSSRYSVHTSLMTALVVGLFGVPCIFTSLDLELEVELYAAEDPARPLLTRTYRFADSRIGGIYYNSASAYGLFVHGLEEMLPEVVRDLAASVRG
jgi:hypothetical protein